MQHEQIIAAARGIDSTPAYAVYVYLLLRNGSGGVFPKQATIAEDTGISERQVRSAIDTLVSIGKLQKERRGKCLPNLYSFPEVTGGKPPLTRESDRRKTACPERRKTAAPYEHKQEQIDDGDGGLENEESTTSDLAIRTRDYLIRNLSRLGASNQNPQTSTTVDQIAILAAERAESGEPIGIQKIVSAAICEPGVANRFGLVVSNVNFQTGDELKRRMKAVRHARGA